MTGTKKFSLGFFPTPLHELKNLEKDYPSYRIFIKRDDMTGLASGGNKTRKLEYLIGQAIEQGADTVITAGAQQSNHCRQTAAAAAMAGLECHLMLGGEKPELYNGNLLLSILLGARIHYRGESRKGEDLDQLAQNLSLKGKKAFVIPYGGSNITGATGYLEAAGELKKQLDEKGLSMDYIFFASSSGGMQAGLTMGMKHYGLESQLMPVRIDKQESEEGSLKEIVHRLIKQGDEGYVGSIDDIPLIGGYEKAGYGVVTHREKTAIRTLARKEGIILDPVYTGRAFYGMMDHMEKKKLPVGSNILFWHTGGLPANFSYAGDIV